MSIAIRKVLAASVTGIAGLAIAVAPASASTHPDSVAVAYNCSLSTPLGSLSYAGSATFKGSTPAHATVGATVVISGFQASVSIPGSVLDEAYGYGVRSITATVTAFDVNATDATVTTVNVAKKPVKVGHIRLASSGNPSINATVPRKPAKVGSWVASAAGTMVFSAGSATLHAKSNLGSVNVQCSASPGGSTISTTTVS